jgi:hypothetical protein
MSGVATAAPIEPVAGEYAPSDSARPASVNGTPGTGPALYPFFPIATHKFVVLSLCTLGFYQLYWAYRNWQRIARRDAFRLSPFWRAFFAPIWGYELFKAVRSEAGARGVDVTWRAGPLALLYFALSASWRMPDPWWLLGLVSLLPLIPVTRTIEAINERAVASEDPNRFYSGANVITITLGGLLLLLALIGAFSPD